jgi:hypothetical protein
VNAAPKTVDDFVATRVLPEHRETVARIRELMRSHAPAVSEVITYGIPGYRRRRIIAVISPTKMDITFSFSRGAQMEDRYGMLRGVGKSSKHIKIKSPADFNATAVRYYVKQAVALDDL